MQRGAHLGGIEWRHQQAEIRHRLDVLAAIAHHDDGPEHRVDLAADRHLAPTTLHLRDDHAAEGHRERFHSLAASLERVAHFFLGAAIEEHQPAFGLVRQAFRAGLHRDEAAQAAPCRRGFIGGPADLVRDDRDRRRPQQFEALRFVEERRIAGRQLDTRGLRHRRMCRRQ